MENKPILILTNTSTQCKICGAINDIKFNSTYIKVFDNDNENEIIYRQIPQCIICRRRNCRRIQRNQQIKYYNEKKETYIIYFILN